jgi:hypothetical protein
LTSFFSPVFSLILSWAERLEQDLINDDFTLLRWIQDLAIPDDRFACMGASEGERAKKRETPFYHGRKTDVINANVLSFGLGWSLVSDDSHTIKSG